eukprot:10882292-Alexandrium_andersonii.AAC.1
MSASLVGSEMCIRDSLRTSVPRSPNGRPSARAEAPSARRVLGSEGAEAPVSYTHLTLPTICSV